MSGRLRRLLSAAWAPLAVWTASRVLMTVAFAAGVQARRPADVLRGARSLYDANFFALIATRGYAATGAGHQAAAYYPGYPVLVRAVHAVVPDVDVAMIVVSNLALLVAAVCLYRLYAGRWGGGPAAAGLALLLAAPDALFLGIGYSESAFLAAVAAAFLAAERGRWTLAGAAAGAAAAVRFNGALLAVPLLVIAWESGAWRTPVRLLPGVVLFVAGLAAYPMYLGLAFGDYLLYPKLESTYWHHRLTNPLQPVSIGIWRAADAVRALVLGRSTSVRHVDAPAVLQDGGMMVAGAAAIIAGFRRLPWSHWAWTLMVPIPALLVFQVPDSFARYMLAAFPIYFLGGRLALRVPPVLVLLVVAGLAFQAVLALHYAEGYFIG